MLYCFLTGRIGKDGDLRYLATGTPILVVSVATDTGFGDRKKTVWVKCNVWGKRGESLAPYIKKGGEISLVGELSESEWTDQQGVARKNLEMDVKEIQLVGGKPAEIPGHQTERYPQPNGQPKQVEYGANTPMSKKQYPSQAKPAPNNEQQLIQTQKEVVDEMAGGFDDLDPNSEIPF